MQGLNLFLDFVTEAEEQEILALVPTGSIGVGAGARRRGRGINRMIRFGTFELTKGLLEDPDADAEGYGGRKAAPGTTKRRSYRPMNDGKDVSFPDIPPVLQTVIARMRDVAKVPDRPNAVILNEYLVGQRVGRHIDHRDSGITIPVLGLLSEATIRFTMAGGSPQDILFPRRALMVLTGESRSLWHHETLPAKAKRYAVVFRTVGAA